MVTNFEDCPLGLQIVKNLGVHLNLHLIVLTKDRIQAVVEHARLLLTVCKPQLQVFIFIKDRGKYDQIKTVFENLSQNSAPVNLLFLILGWKLAFVRFGSERVVVDLGKVFNIFNAFLEVCDPINKDSKQCIQRYLPIDESLSMHEAGSSCFLILFALFKSLLFMSGKELLDGVVRDFNCNLTNYAIFTLAVARAIKEQNTFQHCLFLAGQEASSFVIEVIDQFDQIFKWQLRITNNELTVVLIQCNADIKQLSCLLTCQHLLLTSKQSLD